MVQLEIEFLHQVMGLFLHKFSRVNARAAVFYNFALRSHLGYIELYLRYSLYLRRGVTVLLRVVRLSAHCPINVDSRDSRAFRGYCVVL